MMLFKNRHRIRQWALLGTLLRDAPVVPALGFLDLAFGRSAVHWAIVQDAIARGDSLHSVAEAMRMPEEVLAALRSGESDGKLPEALEALSPGGRPGDPAADDAGVVGLVDELLAKAVESGWGAVEIQAAAGGDFVPVLGDGAEFMVLPATFVQPLRRRVAVMIGRPYWSKREESGVLRVRLPKGTAEFRATLPVGGGIRLAVEKGGGPGKPA